MQTYRFGRKLKLPSTRSIKHEVLSRMLQDSRKAQNLNMATVEKADKVTCARTHSPTDAAAEATQ
jgi:hypothetical protein